MFQDWEPAEVIAFASTIAAIVSALVAGAAISVNAWLQNRRLTHDAGLHDSRLTHERRESLTNIAAAGYGFSFRLITALGVGSIEDLPKQRELADQTFVKAIDELEVIIAVGWSPEV